MTGDIVDVKAALTESLTELHLPTVRRIYEEAARLAERETLSYERYLLDLVTRESQDIPGDQHSCTGSDFRSGARFVGSRFGVPRGCRS